MEQHIHPHHIHPGKHPLSSSLSSTASAPRQCPGRWYLHSCSSPSPQLCSASTIPRRWGPGLCSTAAVPRSQETASINHRHIHPSPDPEMAIPRLGLSPGNPVVSCRVEWEGRGRQGECDMQQGSRGARHGGLAGKGSGTAQGTLAPATHTVGYFKVCHVRAASVPLWANL